MTQNFETKVVEGFGQEWSHFDQSSLESSEAELLFQRYFSVFPWNSLPPSAVGFDLGCGSGRWAQFVAPRVHTLHAVDASLPALNVARRNLRSQPNCQFHHVSVENLPFADESMDFGYSLGVLHHIPDTLAGLKSCVQKLKKGAPFLLYLYYRFDNRPLWFRLLWKLSDQLRFVISRTPFWLRIRITNLIAALIYWPLARTAGLLEKMGLPVGSLPLSAYRQVSFYSMKTDSLDRFGTQLERRFTAAEMKSLMESAGLEKIQFSSQEPFWVAVGTRR